MYNTLERNICWGEATLKRNKELLVYLEKDDKISRKVIEAFKSDIQRLEESLPRDREILHRIRRRFLIIERVRRFFCLPARVVPA